MINQDILDQPQDLKPSFALPKWIGIHTLGSSAGTSLFICSSFWISPATFWGFGEEVYTFFLLISFLGIFGFGFWFLHKIHEEDISLGYILFLAVMIFNFYIAMTYAEGMWGKSVSTTSFPDTSEGLKIALVGSFIYNVMTMPPFLIYKGIKNLFRAKSK